ncbi:uncharacterized protein LOC113217283 [Frankliniella occidentalis]|uniref:Uncharacterized protein LOC113217283 n=1 Tax=Frankliniella occidentalis TaxID=133901 RepID=A0A9C6X220_FRAOC|nr:uncharacterized protein LOC113217283 [Frankliniella occidentalis]
MMASSPDSRRVAAVCSQSPPLPLHVCRVALRPAEGEGGAEQPQQPAGRDCKWTARSDSDDDDDAVPRTALVRQQCSTGPTLICARSISGAAQHDFGAAPGSELIKGSSMRRRRAERQAEPGGR